VDNKNSNPLQPDNGPQTKLDLDAKGLTRRQFLTYALGGTGAFMGSLVATPLVISALDPLHRSGGTSLSKTSWKVSDFNDKLPTHVSFQQHIDDAWNSQDKANDVYVIIYQRKLMIMSHVCTHLGCHVGGSEVNGKSVAPKFGGGKEWFLCPCHGSQYNVFGVPTPSSPAPRPLDLYTYDVTSTGHVMVGNNFTRTKQTWDVNHNPTVV